MKDDTALASFEALDAQGLPLPLHLEPATGEGLTIRALNPDNHREAEALVKLLSDYYGADHPFGGVHDPEYWCSQVQDLESAHQIISMVGQQEGRLIAHIALRYDNRGDRFELFLPAIDRDHKRDLFAISRLFWERITAFAAQQGWKFAFQYSSTSESALQIISVKCFDSFELALFPASCWGGDQAPGTDRFCRQDSLLLMAHFFSPQTERMMKLYPPKDHRRIVQELYAPLQLPRLVTERRAAVTASAGHELGDALAASSDLRLGLQYATVLPSRTADLEHSTAALVAQSRRFTQEQGRFCVRVALDDPGCPAFCAALEERGFRFCGIFPLADEHDYILYSSFEDGALAETTLYTPRAQALKSYILAQG